MTETTGALLAGGFTLPTREEDVYAEIPGDGGVERYVRVRNTEAFTGGPAGTSVADLLQVLRLSGAAAHVGIDRSPEGVHSFTFDVVEP